MWTFVCLSEISSFSSCTTIFSSSFLEQKRNLYQEMLTMKMHVNDPLGSRLRRKRCVHVMWCIQMKTMYICIINYILRYAELHPKKLCYCWILNTNCLYCCSTVGCFKSLVVNIISHIVFTTSNIRKLKIFILIENIYLLLL